MKKSFTDLIPMLGISFVLGIAFLCGHPQSGTPQAEAQQPILSRIGFSREKKVAANPTPAPPNSNDPFPVPPEIRGLNLSGQSQAEADSKSWGCINCHAGSHDPHTSGTVRLGCTDCHGGNANCADKSQAHVNPIYRNAFTSSANPVRSYTLLNQESPEFIRFANPGDLRVAHLSCGLAGCHPKETLEVKKSMMTHGCMLWGAALYNNGSVPSKHPRYGESYSMLGNPQRLQTVPPPSQYEIEKKGVLPYLDPLPRFQISQPGNVLRIFERGGRFFSETGIPEVKEEPGRPRTKVGVRGLGTQNRTDPVLIGLQKTRLLDPTLNFLGTNDHPGDYRSSGCTGCHMVYANDRSEIHSGPYAKYGNLGQAAPEVDGFVKSVDPMIPKDESGHPVEHRFTRAIPTSQCIICHVHPGTNVMNSYLGYMWWDNETDGELMYPAKAKHPTSEELVRSQMSNPEEAAARGNWSEPDFLNNITDLNSSLRHTQFADFHGHGWVFRAVYKKDREGRLLDHFDNPIENVTNAQLQAAMALPLKHQQLYRDQGSREWEDLENAKRDFEKCQAQTPVHLMDIHLEKGMHCVDCHFIQDVHGNTKLYGEVRAAIEIQCIDCHGTTLTRANLRTSGPAATERPAPAKNGRNLAGMRTPFGKRRFEAYGDRIIQNSMVEPNLSWEIKQVADTIDPQHANYNALSALSKTVRFEGPESKKLVWGGVPNGDGCAHANDNMSCIACHSAWNPSCYGCHLPQKANKKMPDLHNEGDVTRNYVSYNFQTLRDDVYMLGRDGDVTGNRIGPARSSCAIHVGSYNANRESIYVQQQTISGDGMSGIAFSTNVPHTVRGKGATKTCVDCHLAENNDNNAIMAQLLMQGTNYLNFIGRYCWVAAGEHGLHAVEVTERDEPQAVFGSHLHRLAFPDKYAKHVQNHSELEHEHEHPGYDVSDKVLHPRMKVEILNSQLRGEFLYAACGAGGVRVFDVAFIDHKGFSERIVTAPVSPIGQKFYVRTQHASAIAAPTTIAPDPTRKQHPENKEQAVHPLYAYLYVADKCEGLILIGAGSLLDGDPTNNFLERSLTYNPNGILTGATAITIVGTYAYLCCDAGLVVIDLNDPLHPQVTAVLGEHEHLHHPHAVQFQFRYGFVCDEHGVQILDVTDLAHPHVVTGIELEDAHNIYVARTYAYVAAGKQGLVILDVKNPEAPRIDQIFDAGGCINDLHDVKLGITYVSEFAYLADGENGLRVVQLTSPETPGNDGFTPRPTPQLIATFKLPHHGHALSISKGVDRDRAVDESGNQLAVFGRIGARPLSLVEQQKMYLRPTGEAWKVADIRRDFTIPDPREREQDYARRLEAAFGPQQTRPRTAPTRPGTARREAR